METDVGRRRAVGTAVSAAAGLGLVFYAPDGGKPPDVMLPWLVGGVAVGVALVAAEWFTPTGRRVREALDGSAVLRVAASVVVAGVLVAAWFALGFGYDQFASVCVGATCSQLLVPALYLRQ